LELDLQDLPVILSAAPAVDKVVKAKPKTHGVTSLLDISMSLSTGFTETNGVDRSNNVGILLARLRLPPAKIRAAVWEVDEAVLDVDQLAMVSRMLPTHDEVCLLVKQRLIPGGKAKEFRWRSYQTG
jgi:diaphanous 1